MSRTYRATGINLKSMPMGEADRLLTILTREHGLIRALAMGSRKHQSSLSGRSGLFVVNDLLIAKGRSLDKVTQAETLESYPKLSQDLKKLTASQYLAELCLCQALSEQPQEELFVALNRQLKQLEQAPSDLILPYLNYAIFQLLRLEGVAPQVYQCCMTQKPLQPDISDHEWKAGFSLSAGGGLTFEALQQLLQKSRSPIPRHQKFVSAEAGTRYASAKGKRSAQLHHPIGAVELQLLQAIAAPAHPAETSAIQPQTPDFSRLAASNADWLKIELLLRQYAEYHFDRPIRSAALMNTCF